MVTDGQVLSADGTPIAFQARGQGEAVVLVPGALQGRTPFRPYAERLAGHLTVLIYDRRGRGASGDTSPYAVEREVEDLEAVISVAGGHASVYGHSSGAALVLHAAAGGLPIRKTVLHDPAFGSGTEEEQRAERAEAEQVAAMLAAGRRADVVRLFFEGAGLPPEIAEAASQDPELVGNAPTLLYDPYAITSVQSRAGQTPAEQAARVRIPSLVLAGGANPEWMIAASRTVAAALPEGRLQILDGQEHVVPPEVLAPVLIEFLTA
ncbi:alpha/beta fold hydrolase [Georgenia sp. TF02-10]|uniref:alpha/beta fold hydrolase n=1 Tax=Georgenia sp. TF02-10 TaxID=2917725 RepID=UPI001FA7BDBC|nr:alpha/beta fold hydrolase [Georgenia sp. TF02-10]UNX56227.1 alpha/beta fold hydrolase [Georgenia sp. TF02-10]